MIPARPGRFTLAVVSFSGGIFLCAAKGRLEFPRSIFFGLGAEGLRIRTFETLPTPTCRTKKWKATVGPGVGHDVDRFSSSRPSTARTIAMIPVWVAARSLW